MKLLYLLSFSVWLSSVSPNQKSEFIVKGQFSKTKEGTKVYLHYYTQNFKTEYDSTNVLKGEFSFQGKINKTTKAQISFEAMPSNEMKDFYLEPNTTIIVKGEEVMSDAHIEGGITQAEFNNFKKMSSHIDGEIVKLYQQYKILNKEHDTLGLKSYYSKWGVLLKERDNIEFEFVKKNPSSEVSYDLVKSRKYKMDDTFEAIFNLTDTKFKESADGKNLINGFNESKKHFIGQVISDFIQKDTLGNNIQLSSLRGKYVLIDFWASWCGPCRRENPNLMDAYQKFKNKNFEILGVSLDKNRQKWVDAIEKDNLKWLHVSDLKGWNNNVAQIFQIRSIPQNILIDPNGIIIAKNMRGSEVIFKLEDVIK